MKKTYLSTLEPEEIIKRLKNGEVINDEESISTIKMIDGVIVKEYAQEMTFNYAFTVDSVDDYYFEEEEKFEITETGLYKTREGGRVFISAIEDYAFGIVEGEKIRRDWYLTGRFGEGLKSRIDIVSKWED